MMHSWKWSQNITHLKNFVFFFLVVKKKKRNFLAGKKNTLSYREDFEQFYHLDNWMEFKLWSQRPFLRLICLESRTLPPLFKKKFINYSMGDAGETSHANYVDSLRECFDMDIHWPSDLFHWRLFLLSVKRQINNLYYNSGT